MVYSYETGRKLVYFITAFLPLYINGKKECMDCWRIQWIVNSEM